MITSEQVQELVGKNVELVCFAQFSIYIHLACGIRMTVLAGLDHTFGGVHRAYRLAAPVAESSLMRILESSVVSASLGDHGDLNLLFSNGDSVNIIRDPEFESYHIRIDGEDIIV